MRKVTKINQEIVQMKKLRVGAYCRVSTMQSDQRNSYDIQKSYFRQLFDKSVTEELVDVYADLGISGTKSETRPEFQRMLDDCRTGRIERIYTKSISRFARNTKDCLVTLRELKGLGVTVVFEKEGIDTAKISDEILLTIMEGLPNDKVSVIWWPLDHAYTTVWNVPQSQFVSKLLCVWLSTSSALVKLVTKVNQPHKH